MKNIRFTVVLFVICLMFTIVFSACNPINPPHTHTFSDEWTFDDDSHWHVATCDDIAENAIFMANHHEFMDNVCIVCGYEKSNSDSEHIHSYSKEWSTNDYGHWLETTCGHSVDNFAPHSFVDDVCTVCGYDRGYVDPPAVSDPTDGLEYQLNADGKGYTVVGFGTAMDSVIVIPSIYNGLPVTAIGERAFSYPTFQVESVVLPNSLISIGSNAFFGCIWDHIVIPSSVTRLDKDALFSVGRKSIVVEQGNPVYHSDNNCLIETATKTLVKGCENSKIPTDGSVTKIGHGAFNQVLRLTSISIPDTVTEIGDYAFYRCLSLTEIVVPNSVITIGDEAFAQCSKVKSLTLSDNLVKIGELAFLDCENIESIVLPESLEIIGMWAFWGCESIQTLFIPKNVAYIGEGIIVKCSNLQSISVDKDNLYFYSDGNCLIDRELQYLLTTCRSFNFNDDGSVIYLGRRAFAYNDTLTEFVVSSNIVAIFHAAFSECVNLSKLVISDSVIAIGESVFMGCPNLTNIDYMGTIEQWNAIYKEPRWANASSLKTITCIDGVITL